MFQVVLTPTEKGVVMSSFVGPKQLISTIQLPLDAVAKERDGMLGAFNHELCVKN